MKIKCKTDKGGCGEQIEVTAAVIEDFRRASVLGTPLPCPNPGCSRRLTAEEVKSVSRMIEDRMVIDPLRVKGTKSLAAIGARGVLGGTDLQELRAACRRVAELMFDGAWYSASQIREAAGEEGRPATEGLRRMRELRDLPGIDVEREKIPGTREFRYRLVRTATA